MPKSMQNASVLGYVRNANLYIVDYKRNIDKNVRLFLLINQSCLCIFVLQFSTQKKRYETDYNVSSPCHWDDDRGWLARVAGMFPF